MLEIAGLSKKYKAFEALTQVSLSVGKNEIIGLIGPNGSGKTTLLNSILGFISPTSGSILLEPGTTIGMAVSRKGFFKDMKVGDNLKLVAELAGASNLKALLDVFKIDFTAKYVSELSAGMLQRMSLVQAFLGNPKFDFTG